MKKINEYNGYKVEQGAQFPTYRATYESAKAAAIQFAMTTGNDAKVFGLDENGNRHHLYTARKSAPRT